MKTICYSVATLVVVFLVMLSSCVKDECADPYCGDYTLYELNKSIVQINTTNLATGLETLFSKDITDSIERAHMCQTFINPVRFFNDQSGYFFIETFEAWMIAHATKPELIGTNRINVQDAYGKFYVKDMVNTVKYIGYGFVEYYFDNPTTGLYERKLSFVKSIPSADLFAGAGFYGDPELIYYNNIDAKKRIIEEVSTTMALGIGGVFQDIYSDSVQRVKFCRDFIDYIRFFDDQSGYFFIDDFNCTNVAHGTQKEMQGKNFYDYQDSRGNYVFRDMVDIASHEGYGFCEYYWQNPVDGEDEPKLSFVIKIPGIDYFIGCGIYL